MPHQEQAFFRNRAVLWAAAGVDRYGETTVSATPSEINCRWDDVTKQAQDASGNTVTIDAVVIVSADVPIGSKLWKGRLCDLPGTGYAPQQDVMVVRSIDVTPDIKNRVSHRKLGLGRFRDTLPGRVGG